MSTDLTWLSLERIAVAGGCPRQPPTNTERLREYQRLTQPTFGNTLLTRRIREAESRKSNQEHA